MRAVGVAAFVALSAIGMIGLPEPAWAHHNFPEFNTRYSIQLEGEITALQWNNPHVTFTLSVTSADGETRAWDVATESPGWLRRMGVAESVLAVGDRVTVAGHPALDGSFSIYAPNILLASGEEIAMRGAPAFSAPLVGDAAAWWATEGSTANPDAGLFRVWSTTLASPLTLMPPEGANLNAPVDPATLLTPAAQAAVAGFDAAEAGRAVGCRHKGMPRIMQQPEDMAFVDAGDEILLQIEEYDTVRHIDMTPDADAARKALSPLGYSSGAWEGATLVVTTTRIAVPDYPHALPQSEEIEVVERFTPAEDGSALAYEQVLTDPEYLTAPFRFAKVWIALEGTEVDAYGCGEG